jgi:hypothetical protein
MKKEQIARLLEHWSRPVPGSDTFRFAVVLVNSKGNETMAALYQDSFTTASSHPGDHTGGNPTNPTSAPPWSPQIDPALLGDDPIDPAVYIDDPTDPASAPPWSPQIDPALLGDDPIDPAVFIETQQPTPVIVPPPTPNASANPLANRQEQSRPIPPKPKARAKPKSPPALLPPTLADNPTDSPIQPGDQVNETQQPIPVIANPSGERRLGSSVDVHLTNRQEQTLPTNRPKPKARPKPQKPSPQDPNPSLHQQEEELGRPKRIPKRKIDVYLEAEEKDAQKKKQKKK